MLRKKILRHCPRWIAYIFLGIYSAAILSSQQSPNLAVAKALDKQISQLGSLPPHTRTQAIRHLSPQILQQSVTNAVALASNLAIDGTGDSEPEALQMITTTLIESLRRLPPDDLSTGTDAFEWLAKLVLYAHTSASISDVRYKAAVAKLKTDDLLRSRADFTLTDIQGKYWNLKSLRGRVVLLNFWATWCPPCRAELPDLNAINDRFKDRGLVILSISEEDESTLKHFLSQNKITYPVLLDRTGGTKKQFLVPGFPQTYVYDRAGNLVAESIYQAGSEGFTTMLKQAGLD